MSQTRPQSLNGCEKPRERSTINEYLESEIVVIKEIAKDQSTSVIGEIQKDGYLFAQESEKPVAELNA